MLDRWAFTICWLLLMLIAFGVVEILDQAGML